MHICGTRSRCLGGRRSSSPRTLPSSKRFASFDYDKSGTIDKNEMQKALSCSRADAIAKLDDLMRDVDTNRDGVISWDEFLPS